MQVDVLKSAQERVRGPSVTAAKIASIAPSKLFFQFQIPEPENTKTLAFQEFAANAIMFDIFGLGMLAAVEFDDQLRFETHEVGDIRADRLLSPELVPKKAAVAQRVSEFALEIGLFATKLSSEIVLQDGPSPTSESMTIIASRTPLPQGERGIRSVAPSLNYAAARLRALRRRNACTGRSKYV
ncbi:MAG TPA: hypothetical protein VGL35_13860 [Rhizomicrobium sp.]|jgi:hypothetical protein